MNVFTLALLVTIFTTCAILVIAASIGLTITTGYVLFITACCGTGAFGAACVVRWIEKNG